MKLYSHSTLVGCGLVTLGLVQSSWRAEHTTGLTPEQRDILSHLSIVYVDSGHGDLLKTIRVTGVNLQIVNGLEATNGNPSLPYSTNPGDAVANGLGNVIIGYNEPNLSTPDQVHRTGSHNLISGQRNNYTSIGGLILGRTNSQEGLYSSLLGGEHNTTQALESVIVAGNGNSTLLTGPSSGNIACIVGGSGNSTSGGAAVVVGGLQNTSAADFSTVVCGFNNRTEAQQSAILGGNGNTTVSVGGVDQCVVGGSENTAVGGSSVVSGGRQRTALSSYDWVAGSLFEEQ